LSFSTPLITPENRLTFMPSDNLTTMSDLMAFNSAALGRRGDVQIVPLDILYPTEVGLAVDFQLNPVVDS